VGGLGCIAGDCDADCETSDVQWNVTGCSVDLVL